MNANPVRLPAEDRSGTPMDPFKEPLKLFPKTRWSLVSQARESEAGAKALADLCDIYWYPVYAYFRCKGKKHHDAEDLVQEFLSSLLRGGTFEKADKERGKLREYLIFAAKRFVISSDRKDKRLKRGGGERPISLDTERAKNQFEAEPLDSETPETHFEKAWGTTVLKTTMASLSSEYEAKDESELLGAMLPYLVRNETGEARHKEVAPRFGLALNAFRMRLSRMRQRYGELLRETIADTVADPDEVEEELRHLRTIFDRCRVTQ